MTISGPSAVKFMILMEEWPEEAKKRGLKDPWEKDREFYKAIDDEIVMPNGAKIRCKRYPEDSQSKPASWEDKVKYKLEEHKFLLYRLVQEGYYETAIKEIETERKCDTFGIADKLEKFLCAVELCESAGQCSMYCKWYQGGCTKCI